MELLLYLLKVSACMALLFSFYLLVLRKLTFFKTNRFYLLASLLLSFVIPALQFTVQRIVEPVQRASYAVLFEEKSEMYRQSGANLQLKLEPVVIAKSFNWYSLLPYAYGIVVAILLLVTIWRLFRLFKHTRTKTERINGLKIVPKNVGFTNCSFFNYVFIDQHSLTDTELRVLLRHEEVHAKQYHSIDKLIMMMAKAVLWFNPIVYMYDKVLEEVHEYEADEATSANFGTASYANLLLKLAVSKNSTPLIHNFVKSPIKERIKMLFNAKSEDRRKLMYLFALPLGLVLVWGFTIDVVYASPNVGLQQPSLTSVENQVHRKPIPIEKRSKDYLVPKTLEMEGAFLESNGEINHLYDAKVKVFDGILMAKEIETNLKAQLLIGRNATFKLNDGAVVNGKEIVFDLKQGTYVIKDDPKKMNDSLKRNQPRLVRSTSLTVDTKMDVSYIKKGKMEVFDLVLDAEDMTYDMRNGTITAKTATLTTKEGKITKAESIVFDLKTGTYTTDGTKGEAEKLKSKILEDFTSKWQYLAQDSAVKTKDGFILYGNARIKLDNDVVLTGKKIEVNQKKNSITVYSGTIIESNNAPVEADRIEYDVLKKKGVISHTYMSFDEFFSKHQ